MERDLQLRLVSWYVLDGPDRPPAPERSDVRAGPPAARRQAQRPGDAPAREAPAVRIFQDRAVPGVPELPGNAQQPQVAQSEQVEIARAQRHAPGERHVRPQVAVGQDQRLVALPRGADLVIVATGENWPDALCGSSLAGAVGAPILLTPAAALPQSVKDEIDRLGAENAYILGGTGVVSSAVEAELEGMLDGFVNRLAGQTRYMTSKVVADAVIKLTDRGTRQAVGIVTDCEYFLSELFLQLGA